MVHDTRIIPLDGRPHVGRNIRQYLGDARGRWEGNTLVVETTNFTRQHDQHRRERQRHRHSEALRLTERFTRVAADVLNYEATIDDPKTYTRPWKMLLPLTSIPATSAPLRVPRGQLAIANILSAARTEDRAAEEDAKRGDPASGPVRNVGAAPARREGRGTL